MQTFIFSITKNSVLVDELSGLDVEVTHESTVYYAGIPSTDAQALAALKTHHQLLEWFKETETAQFLVFVHHKKTNTFYAFNDVFGYQEIFVLPHKGGLQIRSTVPYSGAESYNYEALYELLSFQAVMAPQTVYDGVEVVPLAQCAVVDVSAVSCEYETYWDMGMFFENKEAKYDVLVGELRDKFHNQILSKSSKNPSVALSGGIDSGCILGILYENYGDGLTTVSFGPYGKDSGDLESSRITSDHFNSDNTELYPSRQMFLDLLRISPSLQTPISGELLLTNVQLLLSAKQSGADVMYFGYGTQMMLGNLGLNQLWHKLRWFESVTPKFIRDIVYKLYLRKTKDNRRAVLLSNGWRERFVYKYAPLFTREQGLYKRVPGTFVATMQSKLQPYTLQNTKVSDQIVEWCFSSWMNYGQGRNAAAIGRVVGVEAILPYNTPVVARVLAKATDTTRKKNCWNKQLWRDAIKPFIPEHLYERKGKSLTIRYNDILVPEAPAIISYLEGNDLIADIIDCDQLRKTINDLPEPGLLLLRLLSLAIWHDTRIGTQHVQQVREVFKRLTFD